MYFIVIIPVLCQIYEKLNQLEYEFNQKYEGDLILYCISRNTIVCPNRACGTAFNVDTLDEQMNTTWECAECGTTWEETPTHDIKG